MQNIKTENQVWKIVGKARRRRRVNKGLKWRNGIIISEICWMG